MSQTEPDGSVVQAAQSDAIERQMFHHWDTALAESSGAVSILHRPEIARVIVDALHARDGTVFDLLAYCVMPNHVHVVFTPRTPPEAPAQSISKILQSVKGFTAFTINRQVGRRGPFWQDESYDRVVRNYSELLRIFRYTARNPVKAGLAANWQEWPWSYIQEDFFGLIDAS